ncbi:MULTISPECIES: response regulator transcription factor [Stenotrophomonas]|uniref:response regulator transcription factor n=1 Tax=Stenotrophomonas TaxID=40323 RepID=UPI00050A14B0|nr:MULTISPECIES: response regulator transcription factor [Stenotrophomonas]KGM24029.1 transcriptional regulator [Stenotrophomonas maltophilia]MBH1655996.1 response regulator transcription factor [Stenotrophomonas maltophilia]MBH1844182.1 response regulator transcription factor [Stenotrophomonas maltophilia]MBN5158995.1 response regulator transcription factor [Stenotrophomonas maltophilia]MDG9844196.1 response regulator transcription factor [Stenotrophomonas sp. GD04054]
MQSSPWTPAASGSPTPVLLVEDDRRLAELVSDYLHEHGFAVQHVARGDLAGAACRQHAPELVVLDLMLPGLGGIDVCRQIRSFSDVPILMLTACEDDIEQVLGLESGADDYVHKPIEPRLLLARLRALLRRRHGSSNTGSPCRLMHGELLIDRMQREVHLHGQPVDMGTTEFEILWLLASQPGQILSRDQILQAVRGIGFDGLDRSVDVSIGKLRRKLGDDAREPRRIKTVWGRGYQFNPSSWSA